MTRLLFAFLLAAAAVRSTKAPPDEFRARRAALRHSIEGELDGVLLLKGQTEGYDPVFRFAQDPNFYYLTGWTEPDAALLLTPTDEILFLPRHDHRAAWKRLAAGRFEYQVAATLLEAFLDGGCEDPAYSPIVGSGPNGPILHYMSDRRRMDRGEAVVIDAAADCDEYASDITRTVPVDGKFTPRQREVYQVVLGAQKAAIAAVQPGAWLASDSGNSLTKIARDYMDAHGKDQHGEPLGKYFTHDIGHQVGVLVTAGGAKVLSAALPKEPDEIEKAVVSK